MTTPEHPSPDDLRADLRGDDHTLAEVATLAIDAYEAALERERHLLDAWENPNLERLHAEGGTLEMTLGQHPVIRLMAANLGKSLGDAENFVEVQLADPDAGEEYVVTVRRKNGQTPVEQRDEARAERDRLRGTLDLMLAHAARKVPTHVAQEAEAALDGDDA